MSKDYITKIEGAERRFITSEVRMQAPVEENAPAVIEGYAAEYDKVTTINGWFREVIRKGFFDDVLNDDVRCLFNHNPDYILARSVAGKGTLTLTADDRGLKYSYVTPDRQYARDLADAIAAGDVSQSSFAFLPKETRWTEYADELDLRELIKCDQLFDVSPVTYPAYADTSVASRSAYDTERAKHIEVKSEVVSAENKGRATRKALLIINENSLKN